MVEAATEFRKNGFNDSDAATLAKTATVFQNVSDEAISAGESASFIISQMIAFGIEAKDAQSIIDKVNQISNEFSVSSGDLAKALGIVASTSSAMGNSLDETLGMVVAMTEQTRSASKSARGLNTISSRLSQVLDDTSDTGKKLVAIYDDLGISLKDSSGQMRSTYDILSDLHDVWGTLDTDTQKYIALTSSGTNQLNNFLALMNNFDHATEATKTSLNSAGSAMRENEAYQQSLEYQTNNLKATFQDFANNVLDKDVVSAVLKVGDAFLKLANTDIGQFVSKVTLLGGTAWGVESLIHVSKILPTVITQFKNFGTVLSLVAKGSGTFGAAISAAGGFASVALPTFLAVSAALIGIIEAVKYISTADTRKLESLSSSLQETNDKIAEMTATGSEYDTLIQNTENLTEVEKTRLGILQAQLDTLQAQSKEQENAYLTEWQRQQKETRHDWIMGEGTTETGETYTGYVWSEYTQETQATEGLISAVSRLTQAKYSASITDAEYISGLQNELDAHKEQYNNLIKLNELYEETGNDTLKLTDAQEEFIKVYEYQSSIVSDLGNQYANMSNDVQELGNAVKESVSAFDQYNEIITNYKAATAGASGATEDFVKSLFDTNGQLTNTASYALSTNGSMAGMAQSFIQAQQAQSQANFQNLIDQIYAVGQAASITTAQISSMMSAAGVGIGLSDTDLSKNLQRTYQEKYRKSVASDPAAYKKWLQDYAYKAGQEKYKIEQKKYQEQLAQISSFVPSGGGGGGGSSSTKKDQEEVKAQTINTIEELRDYLTDEETRLKLIDPDISRKDLQSTLSEVATIYQSYQDYLSQLKQQGFDETSDKYKEAEAEFAKFLAVLEELFNEIAKKGNFTIEELYQKLQSALGDSTGSVEEFANKLSDANNTAQKTTDSLLAMVKAGKKLQTIHTFSVDASGHRIETSDAFRAGLVSGEDIAWGDETAWEVIREYRKNIEQQLQTSIKSAIDNAEKESEVAEAVADKYEWQNKLLEDKIALEEKLEVLEKAKQRRMLVYSEGRFQYMQDADKISSAQAEYQSTYRDVEQSQIQSLLQMMSTEAASFFEGFFSEDDGLGATGIKLERYPEALRNHMMSLLREKGKGSLFENASDEKLYQLFGSAMQPGEAYSKIARAYDAAMVEIEAANARKEEHKKQIREENVKYYGVDTDFGKKILESQSQEEAAYWTKLRDTKQQMIKDYREAYGDEAASKYFGTDVSKQDTWASNRDLYKKAWENQTGAWTTSSNRFATDESGNISQSGTMSQFKKITSDLLAAEYNVATALDFEGLGNQALYDKIFRDSITKSEIQDLYNKAQYDITKGYLLNLASEMKNNGASGYASGTKSASGGLSLVGENGPELRVLNHGDGILPSGVTDNLWRWGSMTPRDMLDSLAQKAQSWAQTLNISNVTLPNVRDAQSFVSGLRELAQQYVTRRN